MKKILSSLLPISILLFVTSCKGGHSGSSDISSSSSTSESSEISSTSSESINSSSETTSLSSSEEVSSSEQESSIEESSSEQSSIEESSSEEASSESSSSSGSEEYILPTYVGGDLLFSELLIGDAVRDRAVEIVNIGDNTIDLSEYRIEIFRDGIINGPTEVIPLEGDIAPKKTFVLVYTSANEDLLAKADQISELFLNDGTFPMTINNNEGIIDQIGYVGYYYDVAFHRDAVRKVEYLVPSDTYIPYGWVCYPNTDYSHLGNVDCLDNEIIFNSPKLSEEDFKKPYAVDASTGSGGLIEVTYLYGIDGDTSKFNFGYSLEEYDIYGSMSLRYYGVNTPEIAHGGNPADPYGPEAQAFTNSILAKCKHFLVQSVDGGPLTETYGRALGYLWVTYESNPKVTDYFLMSHLIIQNGYSNPAHVSRNGICNNMLYKGISYIEYLYDANQYAIKEHLNIHSGE